MFRARFVCFVRGLYVSCEDILRARREFFFVHLERHRIDLTRCFPECDIFFDFHFTYFL